MAIQFNKHLPDDQRDVDPLEEITELYHKHITSLAERITEGKKANRDVSFLEMKQSEALGAVTALGKVRDLQYYLKNYDILTMRERKEIKENTSVVR